MTKKHLKKRQASGLYEEGEAPVEFVSTGYKSTTTKFLSQQKYYIGNLQAMEILLSKRRVKKILVMNFSNTFVF